MPANIYKNKAGKRIPGTTTIIGSNLGWNKQALMHWANQCGLDGKNHRDVSQRAADTGTIAHALVEAELRGVKLPWPEFAWRIGATDNAQIKQAESAFEEFVNWRDAYKFELKYTEHLLVSENYQYGGQIDIAAVQGKQTIIDIKTSNAIYEDHKIQLAAYNNLWVENYPDEPVGAWYILRLGKEGGFTHESIPETTIENSWRAFVLLRELHELKKVINKGGIPTWTAVSS